MTAWTSCVPVRVRAACALRCRKKFSATGFENPSAALLTVYLMAGRRGGLGPIGSLVSASLGALLGLLVIALKAGLH
jgi:hypothetical protein